MLTPPIRVVKKVFNPPYLSKAGIEKYQTPFSAFSRLNGSMLCFRAVLSYGRSCGPSCKQASPKLFYSLFYYITSKSDSAIKIRDPILIILNIPKEASFGIFSQKQASPKTAGNACLVFHSGLAGFAAGLPLLTSFSISAIKVLTSLNCR